MFLQLQWWNWIILKKVCFITHLQYDTTTAFFKIIIKKQQHFLQLKCKYFQKRTLAESNYVCKSQHNVHLALFDILRSWQWCIKMLCQMLMCFTHILQIYSSNHCISTRMSDIYILSFANALSTTNE